MSFELTNEKVDDYKNDFNRRITRKLSFKTKRKIKKDLDNSQLAMPCQSFPIFVIVKDAITTVLRRRLERMKRSKQAEKKQELIRISEEIDKKIYTYLMAYKRYKKNCYQVEERKKMFEQMRSSLPKMKPILQSLDSLIKDKDKVMVDFKKVRFTTLASMDNLTWKTQNTLKKYRKLKEKETTIFNERYRGALETIRNKVRANKFTWPSKKESSASVKRIFGEFDFKEQLKKYKVKPIKIKNSNWLAFNREQNKRKTLIPQTKEVAFSFEKKNVENTKTLEETKKIGNYHQRSKSFFNSNVLMRAKFK